MSKGKNVEFSLNDRERAFKMGLNDRGLTAEEITVVFNAVKDIHPNAFHAMTVDPRTKKIDFSVLFTELAALPDIGDVTKAVIRKPEFLIEVMDPNW